MPFDIIATLKRKRVLIDVTTSVGKTLLSNSELAIAEALRMPLYVLFVKPDFTKYQLTRARCNHNVAVHIRELSPVE